MTLHKQDGTRLSKSAATALFEAVTDTDPLIKATVTISERFDHENADPAFPTDGQRIKFRKGQIIRTSELNAMYPAATIGTITPATGDAAGGTAIVIAGTNFSPGSTVTVGGTAATSIVVVSPTKITAVTPAKTAGAHNVVVTTDAGAVTKTGGFTTTS
ncbi:IPT/TIG domain-containing protein [Streptosporangium sp. NPDC000563]|uniref:IPT/TIG domain-containing protein n=1 Tax=Streptosporangium sp. NPDC000563 TaxID=3154366 RepID=UPI0033183FAB